MAYRCTPLPLLLVLVFVLGPAGARADQRDPRLDALFEELRTVTDPVVVRSVEQEIWSIWMEVDDRDTALAMVRGTRLLQQGRLGEAEAAFDAAIGLRPRFAEAWNKRATVRYLAGDLAGSMADIRATLSLEPRHFGALSGLGMIYDRLDEPRAALQSYAAALALDPHIDGLRARVEALRDDLAGDRI
ncbi:MAG: tetratricopeptide repeat protein [Pseudomonadota bacterium]